MARIKNKVQGKLYKNRKKYTVQLSCSQCPEIFFGFKTSFHDFGSVSTVIAPLLHFEQRTLNFPTFKSLHTGQWTKNWDLGRLIVSWRTAATSSEIVSAITETRCSGGGFDDDFDNLIACNVLCSPKSQLCTKTFLHRLNRKMWRKLKRNTHFNNNRVFQFSTSKNYFNFFRISSQLRSNNILHVFYVPFWIQSYWQGVSSITLDIYIQRIIDGMSFERQYSKRVSDDV